MQFIVKSIARKAIYRIAVYRINGYFRVNLKYILLYKMTFLR